MSGLTQPINPLGYKRYNKSLPCNQYVIASKRGNDICLDAMKIKQMCYN